MTYQSVGFIRRDDPRDTHHTEVLSCDQCGALVSAISLADHDAWHAERDGHTLSA